MPSATGVNFEAIPLFEIERDPVAALTGEVPLDKLVQVTDLVGLKQTGYVDGRAYYGAVFYKEGVRYAGYFETAGQLIQVYDTLRRASLLRSPLIHLRSSDRVRILTAMVNA